MAATAISLAILTTLSGCTTVQSHGVGVSVPFFLIPPDTPRWVIEQREAHLKETCPAHFRLAQPEAPVRTDGFVREMPFWFFDIAKALLQDGFAQIESRPPPRPVPEKGNAGALPGSWAYDTNLFFHEVSARSGGTMQRYSIQALQHPSCATFKAFAARFPDLAGEVVRQGLPLGKCIAIEDVQAPTSRYEVAIATLNPPSRHSQFNQHRYIRDLEKGTLIAESRLLIERGDLDGDLEHCGRFRRELDVTRIVVPDNPQSPTPVRKLRWPESKPTGDPFEMRLVTSTDISATGEKRDHSDSLGSYGAYDSDLGISIVTSIGAGLRARLGYQNIAIQTPTGVAYYQYPGIAKSFRLPFGDERKVWIVAVVGDFPGNPDALYLQEFDRATGVPGRNFKLVGPQEWYAEIREALRRVPGQDIPTFVLEKQRFENGHLYLQVDLVSGYKHEFRSAIVQRRAIFRSVHPFPRS